MRNGKISCFLIKHTKQLYRDAYRILSFWNALLTHLPLLHRDPVHSCLTAAKSKMVVPRRHGEHDILSLLLFPTAPGSCLPNTILPAFITCWTTRHVTGWASQCVIGLINPVWQLPDALSDSSLPSLSGSHIPVFQCSITNMIYSLENSK